MKQTQSQEPLHFGKSRGAGSHGKKGMSDESSIGSRYLIDEDEL